MYMYNNSKNIPYSIAKSNMKKGGNAVHPE